MGIIHYEDGIRVDIQRVDTTVKIEHISRHILVATDWTKNITVPVGKKWNIVQIGATRSKAGDIHIYLTDPTASQVTIKELAATNILTYDVNFSITGDWIITVLFNPGISGPLVAYIMYSEEDEY